MAVGQNQPKKCVSKESGHGCEKKDPSCSQCSLKGAELEGVCQLVSEAWIWCFRL